MKKVFNLIITTTLIFVATSYADFSKQVYIKSIETHTGNLSTCDMDTKDMIFIKVEEVNNPTINHSVWLEAGSNQALSMALTAISTKKKVVLYIVNKEDWTNTCDHKVYTIKLTDE